MTSSPSAVDPPEGGREALIRAAVEAIEADGLAAVTLRGITRRASVSHAAPAHHFGDKAGLFTAVAVEGFEILERALSGSLAANRHRAAKERLHDLAVTYTSFAVEHRAHFEVMFRAELLHGEAPDYRTASALAFQRFRDVVGEAAAEGWGIGLDVDTLSLLAWSSVHGVVELSSHGALREFGYEPDTRALSERLARVLTDMLDRELAPPGR